MDVNQFTCLENKYRLLDDTICGFRYWAYIRRNIYNGVVDRTEDEVVHIDERGHTVKSISQLLSIFKNMTVDNPLIACHQSDILFISHARRVQENGLYKCIYTDDIADKFGQKAITGEFIYLMKHFKPAYTKNLIYFDCVDIIPTLYFRIDKYKLKKDLEIIKSKTSRVANLISNEIGINIDEQKLYRITERRYIWYRRKKEIIRKILLRIKPKVIVEVVGYEVNKMIFNEVASELGIQTVELQHGPIGPGKLAYNYLGDTKYTYMPDKLLTFSEYWKNSCSFPIGENNIIPVGYPYMEEQHHKYPRHIDDSSLPTIIVLSQPAISEELQKYILSCLDSKRRGGFPYKIIYKLHPSEYSRAEEIKKSFAAYEFVEIVDNSSRSLYELFSISDIQIGVFSTAIYEGLSYNLETWLYLAEGADVEGYMGDLFKMGYASKIISVDDFYDSLESWNNKEFDRSNKANNPFFMNNAIDNICRVIKEGLEGKE